MTWDSQNRMVSCAYSGNTLAFDYGSDGLRRSETLTSGGQSVTTYYVYDGQSLVLEDTKNAQGNSCPRPTATEGICRARTEPFPHNSSRFTTRPIEDQTPNQDPIK